METNVKYSPLCNIRVEMGKKPPKTIVNSFNENEMREFKERRCFDNWKDKAHFYFDKLWRDAHLMTRSEAYLWLAEKFDLDEKKSHFKQLNTLQCADAIWFCQQLLNDNRRLDLDFGAKPITPFYILED